MENLICLSNSIFGDGMSASVLQLNRVSNKTNFTMLIKVFIAFLIDLNIDLNSVITDYSMKIR